MSLTPGDIFELQVAIAKAISASTDSDQKSALREELEFYQVKKLELIAANNQLLATLLERHLDRLEKIIAELQRPSLVVAVQHFKQLTELVPAAPESPSSAAPPKVPLSVEEKYGLTADVLRAIQANLKERGYYHGTANGLYDSETRSAIRAFQRVNGLNDDGIPGRRTQSALWPAPIGDRVDGAAVQLPAPPFHPSANTWPAETEVATFFGERGMNQAIIDLPFHMKLAWDKRKKVSRISCHERVADALLRIFAKTLAEYGEGRISELGLDLYAGCYNNRLKIGGNTWSMHAWAIAVDIDSERNLLKWDHTKAELAKPVYDPFWRIVESEGAISLGRAKDYDWMHFQFARP